jgi:hypothetical protein
MAAYAARRLLLAYRERQKDVHRLRSERRLSETMGAGNQQLLLLPLSHPPVCAGTVYCHRRMWHTAVAIAFIFVAVALPVRSEADFSSADVGNRWQRSWRLSPRANAVHLKKHRETTRNLHTNKQQAVPAVTLDWLRPGADQVDSDGRFPFGRRSDLSIDDSLIPWTMALAFDPLRQYPATVCRCCCFSSRPPLRL